LLRAFGVSVAFGREGARSREIGDVVFFGNEQAKENAGILRCAQNDNS
jgi:hypothetical protein